MNLTLNWGKCNGGGWCELMKLNLQHPYFANLVGVYLIWNEARQWVRVGQGNIAERLAQHRADPQITARAGDGRLYATWAAVDRRYLDGVECFLGGHCNPLVGDRFPQCAQIAVNLPS
jgi:hypothetical protein